MAVPHVNPAEPEAAYTVQVEDLGVTFPTASGLIPAIDHVTFKIPRGTSMGIVGESGSGKSTLGAALFDSVAAPGQIDSGRVLYGPGVDFLRLDAEDQRRAFGPKISMVFQGNQNTLNPLLRIREQVHDIGKAHGYGSRSHALEERATSLITDMSMDPVRVLNAYPHELSGGMRQRVGILLALLLEPELIVLDEPTTALDVLSQAAVLRILAKIKEAGRISFIFISHDISVVSQIVDIIAIMYAGHLVEEGPVESVLADPRHPYAKGLIGAIPPLWGSMDAVQPLSGHPPNMAQLPSGCAFYERCPVHLPRCQDIPPPIIAVGERRVMCHLQTEEGMRVD